MLMAFTHVSLLVTPEAEALRTAIPKPVTLVNMHKNHGTTLPTSNQLMHSKYLCTSAPFLAV